MSVSSNSDQFLNVVVINRKISYPAIMVDDLSSIHDPVFEVVDHDGLWSLVAISGHKAAQREPVYRDFRPGDIRHSLANISKARSLLGYEPEYSVGSGLEKAAEWYTKNMA